MNYRIDALRAEDWDGVRAVYIEGIATQAATFETEAPSWEQWDTSHLDVCRLVARDEGLILGWAALSPVSSRCVYAGVAEVCVYVAAAARAHGVGRALLQALIANSERLDIWTLQAGVFPENAASLAICRHCGFREVGRRERLGKLRGVWRDVPLIERRSRTVGLD